MLGKVTVLRCKITYSVIWLRTADLPFLSKKRYKIGEKHYILYKIGGYKKIAKFWDAIDLV